jgi:hypothetical protein
MGWKGTGKKICGGCKKLGVITPLIKDNCPPSVFKKGYGQCRSCMNITGKNWRDNNPEKRKLILQNRKISGSATRAAMKFHRTIRGKHNVLRSKTRHEDIPRDDLLLRLNFYSELIRDNECHYCLGPLNPTSHSLDCVVNEIGHRCFNVVPCCGSCNQKKMDDTTYEEMMLLVPGLREIRRRRELSNVDKIVPDL